jgi:hypothetical protein
MRAAATSKLIQAERDLAARLHRLKLHGTPGRSSIRQDAVALSAIVSAAALQLHSRS